MNGQTHFFKLFDLFGVMFNFRMQNYNKFRSKTGAIVTILCLFSCLLASIFDILDFMDPKKNFTEKIFFKKQENESINFINQNFTFALNLPQIVDTNITDNNTDNHIDPFWIVEMKYKYSEDFKEHESRRNYSKVEIIETKDCNINDFNTSNNTKIVKNLKLRCYQFNPTQRILGDYFAKIFSYLEIKLLTRKKYYLEEYFNKDLVFFDVFYPKNILKEYSQYDQLEKIMTNLHTPTYFNQKLRQNIFLKKSIYTDDLGIIFSNKKEHVYTNYDREEKEIYHLNSRENKDDDKVEIAKIFFREGKTTERYEKSVKKLFQLLKSILSSLVNILLVTRFFMEFVNLLKAKKAVIETCVAVDKCGEENYKINPQRHFIEENKNKRSSFKPGFENFNKKKKISLEEPKNQEEKKKKILSIEILNEDDEKKKGLELTEVFDEDSIKDEKNLHGTQNTLFSDSNKKNLNEKMINEEIKNEKEDDNDNDDDVPQFTERQTQKYKISSKMNLRTLLWTIFCCKFKKTDNISKMFKFTTDKFNNYLYIVEYIRRMEEIETLKKYLFDNAEHKRIFERLSIPKLKIRNDEIVPENLFQLSKNDKDSSYLKSYYFNFEDKLNKTEEEKKFLRMIDAYIGFN